jgi:tetratricopeptide (TPR) repeat protein
LFVIVALVAGGYLLVQTRLGNGIQLGRNVRTPTPAPAATPTRSVDDFLRLADDASARGDYRAAIDFLDKASRRKPNDPEPHRKAARLLVFINQPAKAEQRARKALEIDPNHLPSRAVLCMALDWQKRVTDALAECQAVVAADPNYAIGHAYLSEALADSGDFAGARSAAQTAVDLDPESPDALRNLGYAYDVFGQYDTALYHYQRALERDPNMPHVLTAIGRIYSVTGQTANAIKTFKRVVEMDPQNADAQLQLGRVYRFIGERGQAMEALDQAVELDPQNVRPLTERALLNFQMRNYFGSVDDYTRALTNSQQISVSLTAIDYLYYGFAYRWIQECGKAREMWTKSLELAPGNEEIQGNVNAGLEACQRLE